MPNYIARLIALVPRSWFSDAARVIGGNFYALMAAFAVVPSQIYQQLTYAALQTRLNTATGTNLEAIAYDLFGPGYVRYKILSGNNLVVQTDAQFRARIFADLTLGSNTLAAIQFAVTEYLNFAYVAETLENVRIFGLDTAGGLDTVGSLDGRPNTVPAIPAVTVFDIQSDPKSAAKIGLTTGQFCILLTYGGLAHSGFFLGHTFLGQGSFLLSTKWQVVPPLTSTLAAIVNKKKAVGFQPVYADNRV